MEKDIVIKEKVKFAGIGDFKKSYEHAYNWLKEEFFDITEEKYTEKIKGDAKELEIIWTALKQISDYFRIRIEIKWEIFGMTDVEVEIDGKKKKMNKFVELKLSIKGVLEKDYTSKWDSSPIQRFLKDTYHKYIIPKSIEDRQEEVMEVVQEFKDEIKAFFDLLGKRAI